MGKDAIQSVLLVSSRDQASWGGRFSNPAETGAACVLSEVPPVIAAAEACQQRGLWVVLLVSYGAAAAFDSSLKAAHDDDSPLVSYAAFDRPSEYTRSADSDPGSYHIGPWEYEEDEVLYTQHIKHIQARIAAGATYQVNYTFPVRASFSGDPKAFFHTLTNAQQADYCACIQMGEKWVLSLSPELFFKTEGEHIIARPMKGTARRGRFEEEDRVRAGQLHESAKNRAENIMIVDMLRNDIGRIAQPGSVKTSELFRVELYPTLLQMTSGVRGHLSRHHSLYEILQALFPCGSVTGAPKRQTMEIIAELERKPRSLYTGTIGFLKPDGSRTFNVAIRTLTVDGNQVRLGVGSGITIDSTPAAEYRECFLKADFVHYNPPPFALLETLKLSGGRFYLLDHHLERMQKSAAYFDYGWSEERARAELDAVKNECSTGEWKVRLLMDKRGACSTQVAALHQDLRPWRVALATHPVHSENPFLFHKTTHREVYEQARQSRPDADDVLLWNEDGLLTESCCANVVIKVEGKYLTPPRSSGLLAGTFRDELVRQGRLKEACIDKQQFYDAAELYLINSVRGWITTERVV